MSKPRVFKSSNIILGEKKEISFSELQNLIKIKQDEFERAQLREGEDEEPPVDLEELNQQAEMIISQAEEISQQMIADAQKDSQSIIQEAYIDSQSIFDKAKADGYEEGMIQGKNDGYQAMEEIIQEAAEIKQQSFLERQQMAKAFEGEVIQLVIETVKKVIGHEINENHELLLNLVMEGLQKLTFAESLIIRVSEEDYDLVNSSKHRIYMMTEGVEKMEIKCEPSLSPGSVLIDTLSGTIDSSIDTQIKTIEKLFNELLRSE
ncbi:FliH/SctL family protein [Alkaliphilus hydrothermalis]|uniref:Flagellar assembly protein FliH n=1 Tax=Alkaliphilus hydrothermalis TaxID=1482730 RepID=A0ABS2NLA0_9FIRM|nr:FliH/SctL family protein [Alkaliphilus hydrothermalis]MBM7613656.1 flagellar assembly protein FliH [Alkaliphilus hydrothermalis]